MKRDRGDTRDIRYENGTIKFPCGVQIQIPKEKVQWIYNLMKLSNEFEKMMTFGVATIPYAKATQIKNHLEKN